MEQDHKLLVKIRESPKNTLNFKKTININKTHPIDLPAGKISQKERNLMKFLIKKEKWIFLKNKIKKQENPMYSKKNKNKIAFVINSINKRGDPTQDPS